MISVDRGIYSNYYYTYAISLFYWRLARILIRYTPEIPLIRILENIMLASHEVLAGYLQGHFPPEALAF